MPVYKLYLLTLLFCTGCTSAPNIFDLSPIENANYTDINPLIPKENIITRTNPKKYTGELIERIYIDFDKEKKVPISFSLFKNDFIIAFISGEIVRINKLGRVVWIFKNNDLIINFSFIKTIDQVLKHVMSILNPDVTIIVSTLNDMHRDLDFFF